MAWDVGLYDNHAGLDAQAFLEEALARGKSLDDAVAYVLKKLPQEDYFADVHLALANELLERGVTSHPVIEVARYLIVSGKDVEDNWRALDATEEIIKEREAVLQEVELEDVSAARRHDRVDPDAREVRAVDPAPPDVRLRVGGLDDVAPRAGADRHLDDVAENRQGQRAPGDRREPLEEGVAGIDDPPHTAESARGRSSVIRALWSARTRVVTPRLGLRVGRADIHMGMQNPYQGFTAVWQRPTGDWPVWIAARTRAEAGVCAMVTFTVLERSLERVEQTDAD